MASALSGAPANDAGAPLSACSANAASEGRDGRLRRVKRCAADVCPPVARKVGSAWSRLEAGPGQCPSSASAANEYGGHGPVSSTRSSGWAVAWPATAAVNVTPSAASIR